MRKLLWIKKKELIPEIAEYLLQIRPLANILPGLYTTRPPVVKAVFAFPLGEGADKGGE